MNSPGLRERKKQKTRWAIQEHALRLFAEQGYEATTVEQIAEAAEISPSTFFRYFPTKEDVVIEDQYDPMLVSLFEAEPAGRPAVDALRHTLRKAFSRFDEAEKAKVWTRLKLVLAEPALRARTYENLSNTVDLIAKIVARRTGRAADDFAVRVFAGACVGAWLVALQAWADGDGRDDLADLIDTALSHLRDGVDL